MRPDLPPHRRPVNTVFQKYALFPHLNVFDNIAFGLKLMNTPQGHHRAEGEERPAHGQLLATGHRHLSRRHRRRHVVAY